MLFQHSLKLYFHTCMNLSFGGYEQKYDLNINLLAPSSYFIMVLQCPLTWLRDMYMVVLQPLLHDSERRERAAFCIGG